MANRQFSVYHSFAVLSLSTLCYLPAAARAAEGMEAPKPAPISKETQACLDCHADMNPGIVADWRSSRHARTTPAAAMTKGALERRVSSKTVPDNLKSVAVGCYECHALNPAAHKDNFDHFDAKINVVVSPNDCRTCHADEAEQYLRSKKAHALGNLQKNPVYHLLVETVTSVRKAEGGKLTPLASSEYAKAETCYACHGTTVTVTGMRKVKSDVGDLEVPVLSGWPNQGVGRVNPDGTAGSCTACHPRHSFAIEIARDPRACSQCHLVPDVPAYDVYRESKHGNIFDAKHQEWDMGAVPWHVGKDFRAPTCAVCHNSLLVTPGGEVIAARTHDFGARLWVRIFGLITSHPQPKSGDTSVIKNADGLPLPTTFTGQPASEFLIDAREQAKRQGEMRKVCQACHSESWAIGHFKKFDSSVAEADQMVLAATQLLARAWELKVADRSNPFDEGIEQLWVSQWLFYANSVRYASAMSGPDYATFRNGWWELTNTLQRMKDLIELKAGGGK